MAERFTRAVDQLGSEKVEQRLGGIYGLERIAEESPDGDMRLVVTELLTAYVRQHAPRDPAAGPESDPPRAALAARKPDVQAAMTVLGRRNYRATDPPLDLNEVDLRGADLHEQNLQKANLSGAQLHGANLHAAQLQGAQLLEAQLHLADLGSAQLQGASLYGADLQADLSGAQLQGADMRFAKLQAANLISAQLQMARLSWAELARAELSKAQLQGAYLSEAHLKGALCNDETIWPDGFDWKKAGVQRSYNFP